MNILAFDTAGSFLSVGLESSDNFFEENQSSGLRHSELLLPAVKRLIEKAGIDFSDLDLIVCSRGPGSFTGLRIGMSTAKGISSGCGAPLVSVNNLDAAAFNYSFFSGSVVPLIDARKQRFYAAVYENGKTVTDYLDVTASELASLIESKNNVLFTGPGSDLFKSNIESQNIELKPSCSFTDIEYGISPVLTVLGRKQFETDGRDSDDSGPFYIRLSDAELSRK